MFPYNSNQQLESKNNLNAIYNSFENDIIMQKSKKYVQNLYKNYKALTKEIKGDLNKWGDTTYMDQKTQDSQNASFPPK